MGSARKISRCSQLVFDQNLSNLQTVQVCVEILLYYPLRVLSCRRRMNLELFARPADIHMRAMTSMVFLGIRMVKYFVQENGITSACQRGR